MRVPSADKTTAYRDAFTAGRSTVAAWQRYDGMRQEALSSLLAEGLETRGREDWVHGNAGGLVAEAVLPWQGESTATGQRLMTDLPRAHRLVFVNGVFAPERSDLGRLPDGVVLEPLSRATGEIALGTAAAISESSFSALNSLFWRDGLRLEVSAGVMIDDPIELQFINDLGEMSGLVPTRNLVHLAAGSSAVVIERTHLGRAGVVEQPLTEVLCGEGARLDHVKIVGGEKDGEHFGSTHVVQDKDSRYRSWEIVTGGSLARRELHLNLDGPGADCDLNALYMGGENQRFDLRTRVNHNAPECETRELYKGILNDRAQGVFDGLIRVARDSQQTSAHQTNRNLLLSDDAVVNSIPRLEIYADDVKCSHGSTTGQLEDEQLFYLRSRGFSPEEARSYLAWAFASEVIESLPVPELRDELSSLVTRSLTGVSATLNRRHG